MRGASTGRCCHVIRHPARAITLVPLVSAEDRHSVIWRCWNKQVRAFTVHYKPKLPSRPEFDVEAAVAKERSKPAAPLLLVVEPAPRHSGWAAAIYGCNGIARLLYEDEDQRGNCFNHI